MGEACHAINLCTAMHHSPVVEVCGMSASARGPAHSSHDRSVAIYTHQNGAVSQISYCAGGDRLGPKERLEVHGQGMSAHLEDFHQLQIWRSGKVKRSQFGGNKGHSAALQEFVHTIKHNTPEPIPWDESWATSWAALATIQSIQEGTSIRLGEG